MAQSKETFMQKLYNQLYQGAGGSDFALNKIAPKHFSKQAPEWQAMRAALDAEGLSIDDLNSLRDTLDTATAPLDDAVEAFKANPFKTKVDIGDGIVGNSLANTGSMVWNAAKAHPFAATGMALGAGANVAGLFDNDKLGGQLLGATAGAAIPLIAGASPLTTIGVGLAGGTLGSLFDKLRAKKEQEQQAAYQQQYY